MEPSGVQQASSLLPFYPVTKTNHLGTVPAFDPDLVGLTL